MADDGVLVCGFREVGCFFTCTGEEAMKRHMETGTATHQMSMLHSVMQLRRDNKQLTEDNRDLLYWKRQQKEVETEHRDLMYWKRQQDQKEKDDHRKLEQLEGELRELGLWKRQQDLRDGNAAQSPALETEHRDLMYWKRQQDQKEKDDHRKLEQLEGELRDLVSWKRQQDLRDGNAAQSPAMWEQKIKEKDDKIQQLSAEVEVLRESHVAMEARIIALTSSVTTHSKQVQNFERSSLERFNQLNESTDTLRVDSTATQAKLNEVEALHGDHLAHMKSDVVNLENEVKAAEGVRLAFQDHVEKVKDEVISGQRKQEEKCSALDVEVKKMKEKLETLDQHYKTLAADHGQMTSKQVDLEEQYKSLTTRAAELGAKNESLEQHYKTLASDSAEMKSNQDKLTAQVEANEKGHATQQETIMGSTCQLQQQVSLIQHLTGNHATFIWKVTNLSWLIDQTKSHNMDIHSPHFFSHERGYKMRLELNLHGFHLSLYFRICKGPHDDDLEWPFTKGVNLEVVDLTGAGRHQSVTFIGGEVNPRGWTRPHGGDNIALRFSNFLALSRLRMQDCLFLVDDTIYFRLHVEK